MQKTLTILISLFLLVACGNAADITSTTTEQNQVSAEAEPNATQLATEDLEADVDDLEENTPDHPFQVKNVELTFKGAALGGIMKHNGAMETTVEITPGEEAGDFTQAQVVATVDIKSLGSDDGMLTDHLLSEDYFEADSYPEAAFESTQISENADGTYDVTGDLTLKGETRSITLEDVEVTNEQAVVDYELNLKEFGVVAEGDNKVDDIAPISVVVSFS